MKDEKPTIALLNQRFDYMAKDIEDIKIALQNNYVTKDQFAPVKKIAYGTVTFLTVVLMGAVGLITTLLEGRK